MSIENGGTGSTENNRNLQEEAEMNRSRILSDAEFIKDGAGVGPNSEIYPSEGQIIDIKERLKTAENTINYLESQEFQEKIDKLREEGKQFDPAIKELYITTESLELEASSIAHFVTTGGTAREEDISAYNANREKINNELRNNLQTFLFDVQRFAFDNNIYRGGGVDLTSGRSSSDIFEIIGKHFHSSGEILDAIMQARDAKLYRAYREKKEITGKM
jgi:hypothetical protein